MESSESTLKVDLNDFMAIGIGPLPPFYQPPKKGSVPPVERKDPTKKPDNKKDKEKKSS